MILFPESESKRRKLVNTLNLHYDVTNPTSEQDNSSALQYIQRLYGYEKGRLTMRVRPKVASSTDAQDIEHVDKDVYVCLLEFVAYRMEEGMQLEPALATKLVQQLS